MKEVTDYLYNRPIDGKVVIDDKIKKSMDAYYAEYGVK
jgi:orotate phosphoribosyltransferase